MFKPKKAFTLIELLVVIAIIGVLATISVIALSNARSKSRDAKRVGNMKQVQTALELFFNDNGRYPTEEEWALGTLYSTSSSATTTYMRVIPAAPTPADGDCSEGENELAYTQVDNGASYSIAFCVGNTTGTIVPGNKTLIPAGIIAVGGGGQEEETPPAESSCSGALIDARDSKTYATVDINGQCWMAENLAYLPAVSPSSAGSLVDPFYYVYGYEGSDVATAKLEANYTAYGALYNQNAAGTACPTGWHLPTDNEWYLMENFVDSSINDPNAEAFRGVDADVKLRAASWNSGTDDYGFVLLPAGYRNNMPEFQGISDSTFFWSSSVSTYGPDYYWSRYIDDYHVGIMRGGGPVEQGLSIRCLQDL